MVHSVPQLLYSLTQDLRLISSTVEASTHAPCLPPLPRRSSSVSCRISPVRKPSVSRFDRKLAPHGDSGLDSSRVHQEPSGGRKALGCCGIDRRWWYVMLAPSRDLPVLTLTNLIRVFDRVLRLFQVRCWNLTLPKARLLPSRAA